MRYDWPGNVRELENALERGVILQEGRVITAEDLPERLRHSRTENRGSVVATSNLTLEELEKEYLLKVLDETGWHKKKASSVLGINSSTLYRKIQRYGLEQPAFVPDGP